MVFSNKKTSHLIKQEALVMRSAGIEPAFQASEACVLSVAPLVGTISFERCYINGLCLFKWFSLRVIPINNDTETSY